MDTSQHDLIGQWRHDAETLRAWGAEAQATAVERCARQLEAHSRQRALESLSLADAVAESGYTYSALQKQVAAGRLENVGTKGSPRIRRADLPKKTRAPKGEIPSIAERVLRSRAA